MNWTVSQQAAIDKKGEEIIVSAAAGSGKTAVLSARVLEYIKNGGSIDRLLIVTFTVKAANEMRARISEAVNEEIAKNPASIHLLKQSMLIYKAKICTIDSLFSEIVRANFFLLDISADFKIVDSAEILLLNQMVAQNVIDSFFEETDNFYKLCDNFTSDKTDEKITEILLQLYDKMQNIPFAEKWLEEAVQCYNSEKISSINQSIYGKFAIYNTLSVLKEFKSIYQTQIENISEIEEINQKFLPIVSYEIEKINDIITALENNDFEGAKRVIDTTIFSNSPTVKGYTDHPVKIACAGARKAFKDYISEISEKIFCITDKDFLNDQKHLYEIFTILKNLVQKLRSEIWQEKLKRNILTFSDVTVLAHRLLVAAQNGFTVEPTELALETQKKYDEIMIDEYQDTNELQDMIFSAISKNRKNIFVVGDIKQSIYKFREAAPEIFYQRMNNAGSENGGTLINLSNNFRSRDEVISFVNFFFSKVMSKNIGQVEYDDQQQLVFSANYPKNTAKNTHITLIENDKNNISEDDEEQSNIEVEARYVAEKISNMLKKGYEIYDVKKEIYRKATPSDFVILLRSIKNKGEIFQKELERKGIPVFCESSTSYFDKYEIEVVLSILKTIDNPLNDIAVAATLRCQCFGFTNDELLDVRIGLKNVSYYDALKIKSQACIKYKECVEILDELRIISRELPIYKFLGYIYQRLSLMTIFGGMDKGGLRQQNLKQLLKYARQYEASGIRGLSGFINFIDKIIDSKSVLTVSNPITNCDSVSILTIHKSKGLEFPICFVSGINYKFNIEDFKGQLLIDKEMYLGTKIRDAEMNIEFTTLQRETIAMKKRIELISEEIRVLYVALTRAKDKLFITSCVNSLEKICEKSALFITKENKPAENYLLSSSTPISFIVSALLLHKNGDKLRSIANMKISPDYNAEDIEIEIINAADIKSENNVEPIVQQKLIINNEIYDTIKHRLGNIYEKQMLSQIPSKLSVSELKPKILDENSKTLFDVNSFISLTEGGVSSAQVGTAVHKLMQYCDFDKSKEKSYIQGAIDILTKNNIFSKEVAQRIPVTKIHNFFISPLAEQIEKAEKVEKEFRFTIDIKAEEYYKILKQTKSKDEDITGERVLIQGVIDCFFIQNNAVYIIDYKTDYVTDKAEFIEKYSLQLELYEKAVCKILKVESCTKIIYSFSLDKAIVL